MTAVPLQSPYCQFFDANGDPLSGGKVYAYAAGTVTPQNTYNSYTGLVANTNPVILDASGQAQIWIIGTYRFDVYDSNNVLIRSVDNVAALNNGGDMTAAVYDPAGVAQQVVGITAVQTLTNKTLTAPTINQPNIVGVTTVSDAAAGSVGELISSTVLSGASVALVANTAKTITSISLTAGDWDVEGNIVYVGAASTVTTAMIGSISATNNSHATPPNSGAYAAMTGSFGTASTNATTIGRIRINVASTTTYYLVATANFTTSTLSAYGFLGARRVR